MRGTVALRREGSTFFDGRAAGEGRFMGVRMKESEEDVKNEGSLSAIGPGPELEIMDVEERVRSPRFTTRIRAREIRGSGGGGRSIPRDPPPEGRPRRDRAS